MRKQRMLRAVIIRIIYSFYSISQGETFKNIYYISCLYIWHTICTIIKGKGATGPNHNGIASLLSGEI